MTNKADLIYVGKRIAQARNELGLSQKQLAHHLGVSWEMISRYERGVSNSLPQLFNLARYLKKPTDYFVQQDSLEQPLTVAETFSPPLMEKLFAPMLTTPRDYNLWRRQGSYSGIYTVPLWLSQLGEIWVVETRWCQIETPLVPSDGLLFVSVDRVSAEQKIAVMLTKELFRVTTAPTGRSKLDQKLLAGYVVAEERRFI